MSKIALDIYGNVFSTDTIGDQLELYSTKPKHTELRKAEDHLNLTYLETKRHGYLSRV
jgi:hypothetical protein